MPNYENFVTYPASAMIANLYVPGVNGNGPATVARFMTGLATDPVNNLITEFSTGLCAEVPCADCVCAADSESDCGEWDALKGGLRVRGNGSGWGRRPARCQGRLLG